MTVIVSQLMYTGNEARKQNKNGQKYKKIQHSVFLLDCWDNWPGIAQFSSPYSPQHRSISAAHTNITLALLIISETFCLAAK
jgi:hypothetical protein